MATQVVMAQDWKRNLDREVHRMLTRIGDEVADGAQRRAPFGEGDLRDSIHAKPVTGWNIEIWADVPYAAWVELGTDEHIIEPTKKKALFWPGAAHPVKRVRHPGTRAQPFMKPALYEATRDF